MAFNVFYRAFESQKMEIELSIRYNSEGKEVIC